VSVRPAGPADVAAIAALEADSFPQDPWPEGYVAEAVAGRLYGVVAHVAEDDADAPNTGDGTAPTVVGHAITSVVFEVAELQRIAVTPRMRRHGHASALLEAVVADAGGKGAERLLLEVRETNAGALAFYQRAGFVEIDRRPRYYRDGDTAIILELSLSRPDQGR
jgi:ribosomal-protein-alanine N-acetyltransferase